MNMEHSGMIVRNCPSANFSTINPTKTNLVMNTGICGKKPVTVWAMARPRGSGQDPSLYCSRMSQDRLVKIQWMVQGENLDHLYLYTHKTTHIVTNL